MNPKSIIEKVSRLNELEGSQSALLFIEEKLADLSNNRRSLKILYKQKAVLHCASRQWFHACKAYQSYFDNLSTAEKRNISEKALFNESANLAIAGDYVSSAAKHVEFLGFNPDHVDGLRNFSIVLRQLKEFDLALKYALKHLELRPNSASALNTVGTIYADIQQNDLAIEKYKESLTLEPDNFTVHCNIANEYHIKAQIDLAYFHSAKAVALKPDDRLILRNHLTQLRRVCAFDELEKIEWWSLFSSEKDPTISNAFLQLLVLADDINSCQRFKNLTNYWGSLVNSAYSDVLLSSKNNSILQHRSEKVIRIGFVSSDFRDHSVARFIWPLFEYLCRDTFVLKCFSFNKEVDIWREKFINSSDAFIDCDSMSPAQFKSCLLNEPVDILFDLTGFTRGSKTEYFVQRFAPIQVSWLGFPGTIGLDAIDYLFVDKYLKPDVSTMNEKCLVTEGTTVCFDPSLEIPITPILPVEKRGFITFGSLNNSYKITRKQLRNWAIIMDQCPDSCFLFVRREFESYYLRENILREFFVNGIDRSRIYFFNNRKANRHYLDCYNEIDLSLDTYPVTGGTTTTDALWMGVPVVALEGPAIHQRVCSSILRHINREDWIGKSDEEFIEIAITLTRNISYLKNQRKILRSVVKESVLCDTEQFVQDFTNAIKRVITSEVII